MIRHLIVLAALAAGDVAIASISAPPRVAAGRADRPAVLAAPPIRRTPKVAPPAQPYQITPRTEVLLDGSPTDYCSIPEGARIEYLEVAPDGVILKVHFLSPGPRR